MEKIFGKGWFAELLASATRQVYLWKGDMITAVDGAQTTLHCVLSDDIESGAFYSQFGVYEDPELQAGGWPVPKSINPEHATPEIAAKLWEVSEKLVGM